MAAPVSTREQIRATLLREESSVRRSVPTQWADDAADAGLDVWRRKIMYRRREPTAKAAAADPPRFAGLTARETALLLERQADEDRPRVRDPAARRPLETYCCVGVLAALPVALGIVVFFQGIAPFF